MGIAGFLGFHFLKDIEFFLPFRGEADFKFSEKGLHGFLVFRHAGLGLVVGPSVVSEFVSDFIPEGDDFFHERDIGLHGEAAAGGHHALAGFLGFCEFDDFEIVEGDVGVEGIFVVAGLEFFIGEEGFGEAFEFGGCEFHGCCEFADIDGEIGAEFTEFFLQFLNVIAFVLGQIETLAAVIADGFFEEFFPFAVEVGISIGEGLHGLVDIIAVGEADAELLEPLDGLGGGVPELGVGGSVLDDDDGRELIFNDVIEAVETAEGVIEGDFAGFEGRYFVSGLGGEGD